eukprot:m.307349 g.307349  ORF g.307349 m.307349 type:complete len:111 (+) comp42179_c0_seq1:27-359(+)
MSRLTCAVSSTFLRLRRAQPIKKRLESSSTTSTESGPPNGFLFNEPPLKPGQKRQKEPWENMWLLGMGLPIVIAVFGLYFKPDTDVSTWGRIEAEKQLKEAEMEKGETVE